MQAYNRYVAALVLTMGLGAQANAATVFTETFASGTASAAFSGAGTVVDGQGFKGLGGFADYFLWNDTLGNPASATILSLTGLAAHTAITIVFDLAFIDSWDSIDGAPSPDYFSLSLDTVPALNATAANASGTVTGSVGGSFTQTVGPQGLGFGSYNDRGARIEFTALHSAAAATFAFFASGTGWQGGGDESWAIDNVTVSIREPVGPAPIPVPAGLPLLATALGAVALLRRCRS